MVWKIATHDKIRDSYADICERWTLRDLYDAHALLDAMDAAEARERAKARET